MSVYIAQKSVLKKIKIYIYRSKYVIFRHISVNKVFLIFYIYRSIFGFHISVNILNFNIDRYMFTYSV